MPEPSEEEILAFQKFKDKHIWPEQTLARQKDLREFKEKFGVSTRSNFHCPWCYTGSLYDCLEPNAPGVADIEIPEGFELYICRDCNLRFLIKCCDPDILAQEIAKKKEERKQRREAKKEEERTPEEMQQMLETYRAAQATKEASNEAG